MAPSYDAIIFDLGDVLFDWDSSAITALPKKLIHLMMNTTIWQDLDCNRLSSHEAYAQLGAEFHVLPTLVRQAIEQAQTTLRVNDKAAILMDEILSAKKRDSRIKVYAMSNISEESFHFLQTIPFPWHVFDAVFTSWGAGVRKPDIAFYRHVIDKTGCDPLRTLYLDDRVENICAGRMVGLRGEIVRRGDRERLFRLVRNLLLDDALQRAEGYLSSNARKLDSVVIGDRGQGDVLFQDNFSQLIIWGLTDMEDIVYLSWPDGTLQGLVDRQLDNTEMELEDTNLASLVEAESVSSSTSSSHPSGDGSDLAFSVSGASTPLPELDNPQEAASDKGLWLYFAGDPVFTTSTFPTDADTTAMAYLNIPASHSHRLVPPAVVAKAMLSNCSPEGYFETYFTSGRPRVSPEVCVNVLRFFVRFGDQCGIPALDTCRSREQEGDPIAPSIRLVLDSLTYRASLYGSRYYTVPEVFLYYAAMLCVECSASSPELSAELRKQLHLALLERLHVKTNPLALAMRVRACQIMSFERDMVKEDLEDLLACQETDGGWPAGHFCTFVKASRKIGSRGLTTALAWRVLND